MNKDYSLRMRRPQLPNHNKYTDCKRYRNLIRATTNLTFYI